MENAPVENVDKTLEEYGTKWKHEKWEDAVKYCATTRVKNLYLEKRLAAMEKEEPENGVRKDILILSGIHGQPCGRNWVKYPNGTRTINPLLTEKQFYKEDKESAKKFPNLKIRVKNISKMEYEEFKNLLTSDNDFILAFCYSRNDKGVQRILRIDPVKSHRTKPYY